MVQCQKAMGQLSNVVIYFVHIDQTKAIERIKIEFAVVYKSAFLRFLDANTIKVSWCVVTMLNSCSGYRTLCSIGKTAQHNVWINACAVAAESLY